MESYFATVVVSMKRSYITIDCLISKHTPAFCTFFCQMEDEDSKILLQNSREERQI